MKKYILLIFTLLLLVSCGIDRSVNEELHQDKAEVSVEYTGDNTNVEQNVIETKTESVSPSQDDYSIIDNSGSGWGFVKKKDQKPDIPKKTQDVFIKYDTYYMDQTENKVLYLTFDEGYENGYTGQILDTLKKCEVPAAFFVTGSYFDRQPELIKRMVDEGHIVGNHTEHHHNLHKLSDPEKIRSEFTELDDKYFKEFAQHMKYMRPPEGEYSERVLAVAKDSGYKTIFWSFAYKDWEKDVVRGSQYAYDAVTPYLHSGCIILLHAVSQDNADALEDIINYAKEHGYVFKSLDDLPEISNH